MYNITLSFNACFGKSSLSLARIYTVPCISDRMQLVSSQVFLK
jgi:hypothetical protein